MFVSQLLEMNKLGQRQSQTPFSSVCWVGSGSLDSTCPDMTCSNLTCPDLTCPDFTCPDLTCSGLTLPDFTLPDLTLPDLTSPDLKLPELTCPNLTCLNLTCPYLTCTYLILASFINRRTMMSEKVGVEEAQKLSSFVVQKSAAPKIVVEFRQGSIGTSRSS